MNPDSKTFRHCSFSNTGISHKHGIVFSSPAEYLNGAFKLRLSADERIKLSLPGLFHQLNRKERQGIRLLLPFLLFPFIRITRYFVVIGLRHLMGNVGENIETRHTLFGQEKGPRENLFQGKWTPARH